MSSPNLAITHVVAAQAQKEVTVNAAIDALDGAVAAYKAIAMSDADYTLSTTDAYGNISFKFTGTLTADRHIILPASSKIYVIKNGTAGSHNLIIKIASGGTVTIAAGTIALVYTNGTDVVAVGGSGGGTGGSVQLAGDLGGTNTVPEVVGISGIPISGSPSNGQALTYNSGAGQWQPSSVGGSAPFNSMLSPASVTAPALGSLTWGNQGGASAAANAGGGLWFSDTANSGNALRHLYKSAPGTPWSLIVGCTYSTTIGDGRCQVGILIRDSGSSKLIFFSIYQPTVSVPQMNVEKYTSYSATPTAYSGFNCPLGVRAPIVWMKLTDDGTNYTWYLAIDGQNWTQILQKSRTDFLTSAADQVGIGLNVNTSGSGANPANCGGVFVHWSGI